jgi:LysR family transcriptional regulator, hypochlorite-specific transcription factor HypT
MGPQNRPLDLDWLEDFLTLAEVGNFSRAAEIRSITQPALSRHIRSLEEWVGVDLIDRSEHPIALTKAGNKFKPLVKDITSALEAARIKAVSAQEEEKATLRFASTHSLSITYFPNFLNDLESTLNLGPIQTMSDSYKACEDLMLQRTVQFVLCYKHNAYISRLDENNYPVTILGKDLLIPVSGINADGNPLYSLESKDLLPVLEYTDASGIGKIMQAFFNGKNTKIKEHQNLSNRAVVFTAHNAFLLKTMAIKGKGIAWIPKSLIELELKNNTLKIAGNENWHIPLEIGLYRQKSEMNISAENIWKKFIST